MARIHHLNDQKVELLIELVAFIESCKQSGVPIDQVIGLIETDLHNTMLRPVLRSTK